MDFKAGQYPQPSDDQDDLSDGSTALLSDSVYENGFPNVSFNRVNSLLQQLIDYPFNDQERLFCKENFEKCKKKFELLSKNFVVSTPTRTSRKKPSFESVRSTSTTSVF